MTGGARGFTVLPREESPHEELHASVLAWEVAASQRCAGALAAAEHDLAMMAVDVADAVLGHAATVDAGVLASTVARALAEAGARRVSVLRLHPDDVASACELLGADPGAPEPGVELRADAAMRRGDVCLETLDGRVTASWRAALALVRARVASGSTR